MLTSVDRHWTYIHNSICNIAHLCRLHDCFDFVSLFFFILNLRLNALIHTSMELSCARLLSAPNHLEYGQVVVLFYLSSQKQNTWNRCTLAQAENDASERERRKNAIIIIWILHCIVGRHVHIAFLYFVRLSVAFVGITPIIIRMHDCYLHLYLSIEILISVPMNAYQTCSFFFKCIIFLWCEKIHNIQYWF